MIGRFVQIKKKKICAALRAVVKDDLAGGIKSLNIKPFCSRRYKVSLLVILRLFALGGMKSPSTYSLLGLGDMKSTCT